MAFFAARGWDTDALDRAANWSFAEKQFFESAQNQYWEDLTELILLAADHIALSVWGTSRAQADAHFQDWKRWYADKIGKALSEGAG
ncbi:MAG: hypothetical protein Q4F79_07450 [Eubacteriales bacterium]|nr:hypothetical protein [Eubacteriales bacterium]